MNRIQVVAIAVFMLAFLAGQAQATIGNDGTTIYIYGANAVHNLTQVNTSINNASVLWNLSGIWYLNKSIRINGTSSKLKINQSDGIIRFASDINNQSLNITVLGIFEADSVSFESWDGKNNSLQWNDSYKSYISIAPNAIGNFTNISGNLGTSFTHPGIWFNAPLSGYVKNSNLSNGYGAIYCTYNCSNVTIENNTFYNNTISDIYISGLNTNYVTIRNNTHLSSGYPIQIVNVDTKTLSLSNFSVDNGTNDNIFLSLAKNITLNNITSLESNHTSGVKLLNSSYISLIDGNYSKGYYGVLIQDSSLISVSNITLSNNTIDILADGSDWTTGTTMSNVNISNTNHRYSQIAIEFANLDASNVTIESPVVFNCTVDNIYLTFAKYFRFSNVTSTQAFHEGIKLRNVSGTIINYGNFSFNGYRGIFVQDSTNLTIFRNNISSNGVQGIKFDQNGTYSLIENNFLSNNIDDALHLRANSSNNVLRNNIYKNNAYSLYIFKNSTNNTFINESYEGFDSNCKGWNGSPQDKGYGFLCYDVGFYAGISVNGNDGITGNMTIINPILTNNNFSDWPYPDYPYRQYNYTQAFLNLWFTDHRLMKYPLVNSSIYSHITYTIDTYATKLNVSEIEAPLFVNVLNASIIPSSSSITVNVTTWNTNYKQWTENSSVHDITTTHIIGDFPSYSYILIKKNGVNWNTYLSNSTGYINFTYNEGYSDVQFEAEVIPSLSRITLRAVNAGTIGNSINTTDTLGNASFLASTLLNGANISAWGQYGIDIWTNASGMLKATVIIIIAGIAIGIMFVFFRKGNGGGL